MEIPAAVNAIIAESLWLFLCCGLVIALIYGLLLLLTPRAALALSSRLNRWVSLRRAFKPLELPRPQDRRLYHYHRAVGAGLFLGSIYILYILNYHYDHNAFIFILARDMPTHAAAAWLADSLRLLLYLFAFIGIVIGPIVFQRPSLLKGLEAQTNRWISSRRLLRFLESSYTPMEEGVEHHPRAFGLLLTLISLYLLLLLLPLSEGFIGYFA